MKDITDEELLHIYVEIAGGRGNHGDFLKSFAEAIMRADYSNFAMLRMVASFLVTKYDLAKYLDNYKSPNV